MKDTLAELTALGLKIADTHRIVMDKSNDHTYRKECDSGRRDFLWSAQSHLERAHDAVLKAKAEIEIYAALYK